MIASAIPRRIGAVVSTTAHAAFPGRVGISPEEFAEATGTGRTLVYLALQRGEIPHKRIGRRIVIPLSALDRWFGEGDPDAA
jgi:excisionase family DNA binding protein